MSTPIKTEQFRDGMSQRDIVTELRWLADKIESGAAKIQFEVLFNAVGGIDSVTPDGQYLTRTFSIDYTVPKE